MFPHRGSTGRGKGVKKGSGEVALGEYNVPGGGGERETSRTPNLYQKGAYSRVIPQNKKTPTEGGDPPFTGKKGFFHQGKKCVAAHLITTRRKPLAQCEMGTLTLSFYGKDTSSPEKINARPRALLPIDWEKKSWATIILRGRCVRKREKRGRLYRTNVSPWPGKPAPVKRRPGKKKKKNHHGQRSDVLPLLGKRSRRRRASKGKRRAQRNPTYHKKGYRHRIRKGDGAEPVRSRKALACGEEAKIGGEIVSERKRRCGWRGHLRRMGSCFFCLRGNEPVP